MSKNAISKAVHKFGFKVKQNSPEILAVAGVIGIGVSAVWACKSTLKVNDVLEEHKATVETIHQVAENEAMSDKYSQEDAQKDLAIAYTQTGMKLATLYLGPVILGVASVGCLLASNNILRKRNIALAAAYTAVDKGFKEYRNRVVDRFGETVDRELKYNLKAKKITETEVNEETGKEKKVKKVVEVVEGEGDIPGCSPYARFFDEASRNWEKNSEYNLMFLHAAQEYMNQRLKAYGHLFLNEVYDYLDIPRTKAGNVVGWVYDDKNQIGDNYVDFGIYNTHRETSRDFVNGYERVILLDFNVTPILDTLSRKI